METSISRRIRLGLGLVLVAVGAACWAAAVGGAAAGAAGAIAYTDRGAKSEVKGNVDEVRHKTEAAFQKMGIQVTDSATMKSGAEHDLKGSSARAQVSVAIVRSGEGISHVEVQAQRGTLSWDKDYAKEVLNQIIHA